jgi:hypothetical protein
MSIFFSLLLSLSAFAWEKRLEHVPRSVLTMAAFNEIAVGLELEGGKGAIEYFDYRGLRTVRKSVSLEEWPLSLRVHGDDLYALTKKSIWLVDLIAGGVTKRAILPVRCFDFIVDRDKSLYCGGADGFYFLEHNHTQWARLSREPVDGVFLLGDTIYLLRGAEVKKWEPKLDLKPPRKRPGGFRYLARSSSGDWLSLDTKGISRRQKTKWLRFESFVESPTQISYLYQMDTKEDHVLVVFPLSRRLMALPYAESLKNTPKKGVRN